jgi:hypothetical protein
VIAGKIWRSAMKKRWNVILIFVIYVLLLYGIKQVCADDIKLTTLLPEGLWAYSTDAGHENDIHNINSGCVGIGTSTPGHFLSVCRAGGENTDASVGIGVPGTGSKQDVRFNLVTKDSNLNGALGITAEDANDKGWRIIACGDAYDPANMQNDLYIQRVNRPAGTSAILLSLDSVEDNVGVGMHNAVARLQIKGATNDNTASAFKIINSSNTELLGVRNDGTVGIGPATLYGVFNVASNAGVGQLVISDTRNITDGKKHRMLRLFDGTLTFQKVTSGGVEEQLVITEGGTVGIGTDAPVTTLATKLHVSGGHILLDHDKQINSLDSGGTVRTLLQLKDDQTEVNYVPGHSFAITRGGTEKVIVSNAGDVGIGRTPLARTLEVEGQASKTAAGEWLANSDARIKTDVQDITGALDIIKRLHPVKFRYKKEYRAKHPSLEDRYYYNFIAQEFQKVFPDSVKDDGEGYLQLDIHNVKPYLVAAVQELSKEMDNLKAQNENLKAKNKELEARLKKLEAGAISR